MTPSALLAWLSSAAPPDGFRVGEWLTITDGGLWKAYYLWALRYCEGQDLKGACANVKAVKAAMEGRQHDG